MHDIVPLEAAGVPGVFAAVFFIVETLPPERRGVAGHSTMRQRYKSLLSDRVFIGVAIIGGMTFSGLFTYLSSSSFLFQDVYGLDPQQYGLLFAANSLGIATAWINRKGERALPGGIPTDEFPNLQSFAAFVKERSLSS